MDSLLNILIHLLLLFTVLILGVIKKFKNESVDKVVSYIMMGAMLLITSIGFYITI